MKFYIFLFVFFISAKVNASKVFASSFGYNATNATLAYKNAIESTADTTIINFAGNGEWNIDPVIFFNLTNKTIIFEANVQLLARAGYGAGDCLLQLKKCNGVKIIGSNTLLKMLKSQYPININSYRHTLAIIQCANIEASNLRIEDSGADGIFIGSFAVLPEKEYSENIVLRNISCNNSRRQGISVISVKNLLVDHCFFKNTIGELPEAGVDLEPDRAVDRLENIEFKKCSFTNNNGSGISVSVQNSVAATYPMSIVFNDCYLQHNYQSDITGGNNTESEIYATGNAVDFPGGTVTFNRCLIENSQWNALRVRKAANGFSMLFNDCVFKDIANTTALSTNGYPIFPPIWVETLNYDPPTGPTFGGLTFNNLLINYTANKPFFHANGSVNSAGLANILGNISIINPTANIAPVYNDVTNQINVAYTYNFINNYPATVASFTNATNTFNETTCNKVFFSIIRTATNNDYPLAVKQNFTGTAGNGQDYLYMPPFNILPKGINSAQDSLVAYNDLLAENVEQVTSTINASGFYTTNANNTFTATLTDGTCATVLPIRFIDFFAVKQHNNHHLQFTVANETGTTKYIIQNSYDGILFNTIAQITGTMNGEYMYNYAPSIKNKIYYRIMFEENSMVYYSPIVSINENEARVFFYPNPSKDILYFSGIKPAAILKFINTQGVTVLQLKPTAAAINISALAKGFYIIEVIDKSGIVNSTRLSKL